VRRFSRRQDVWFHVHLPFVQAVSAPQGEVDEIGLVGQRARAERGAGAKAKRGTTERFRRVGWVGAIRSIVHDLARLQERDRVVARAEWRRSVLKTTRQMSKDAAGVDFIQFLAIRGGGGGQVKFQSRKWKNRFRRLIAGRTHRGGSDDALGSSGLWVRSGARGWIPVKVRLRCARCIQSDDVRPE
jgi:hypothetical protein